LTSIKIWESIYSEIWLIRQSCYLCKFKIPSKTKDMKKLFAMIAVAGLFVACNNAAEKVEATTTTVENAAATVESAATAAKDTMSAAIDTMKAKVDTLIKK
jgi:hypothetical protein